MNEKGYGKFGINSRTYKAHRIAWELMKGTLNPNDCVLHRCDTPNCVNPDHLFLGDRRDNFLDCLAKGRRPLGNPRLTLEQVKLIKTAVGKQQDIADEFGCGRSTVSQIRGGKTWVRQLSETDSILGEPSC